MPSWHSFRRRSFLKISAASGLGVFLSRLPAMAGPFTSEHFDHLVPTDKKISAESLKSLFERATPEVLRSGELKYVGMPIGGIGAGQLYIGGDGRLCHWDIFNQNNHTGAGNYAKPFVLASALAQGFPLKIGEEARRLDQSGFPEVSFGGEYPVATVDDWSVTFRLPGRAT
jgi:non-lysosomal glucosylceramidase